MAREQMSGDIKNVRTYFCEKVLALGLAFRKVTDRVRSFCTHPTFSRQVRQLESRSRSCPANADASRRGRGGDTGERAAHRYGLDRYLPSPHLQSLFWAGRGVRKRTGTDRLGG